MDSALALKWEKVPGKPRDLTAETSTGYRYLVHVGHGELWYALGYDVKGKTHGRGNPWVGPTARVDAIAWCNEHAQEIGPCYTCKRK